MKKLTAAHKVSLAKKVFQKHDTRDMASGELFERALSLKEGLSNTDHDYSNFLKAIRESTQFDTTQHGRVALKEKAPRSKSQATCSGEHKDTEKQDARDFVVGRIRKLFPDTDQALRILGFTGLVGLTEPESMERQVQLLYSEVILTALEEKKSEYNQMVPRLAAENGFSQVLRISAHHYFKDHWALYDVIWLDYYGGVNPQVQESLRLIFKKEMLAEPGLLVITSCQSPRINGKVLSSEETRDHTLECGIENGYKISAFGAVEYNQDTQSPMRN